MEYVSYTSDFSLGSRLLILSAGHWLKFRYQIFVVVLQEQHTFSMVNHSILIYCNADDIVNICCKAQTCILDIYGDSPSSRKALAFLI